MKIRAIIFDLDGTLADTLADIAEAMNFALAHHGLPTHPVEAYGGLVGEGIERLVERALPPGRSELRDDVLGKLREHYAAHMLDQTQPYPGIPELLDEVSRQGLPIAVLSNKPDPATRYMVDSMFDRWSFAAVVGEGPSVPRKPDPRGALTIARTMGVEPEEVLYLGDTRTDMETAVAAGMVPVGAEWGFRDRNELESHGARTVVSHPLELLDLIEQPTVETLD